MQNPFLIARFVLFALLVNLNILILAFSAWNANATIAAGLSVPATTVFFLLNSCVLFFCIILSLADLLVPQANTARVLFECAWAAVLSVFQTGTAISVTVNGPAICRLTSDWDLCASSSLLIPAAWLSSIIRTLIPQSSNRHFLNGLFTVFSHFLSIFITAMCHMRDIPDIWSKTIYSIDWFGLSEGGTCNHSPHDLDDSWTRYVKDIEATRPHVNNDISTKAPWARTIRRGIDAPFTRRSNTSSNTTATTAVPVAPLKVQPRSIAGSRFIEKLRESSRLSRSENTNSSQFATQTFSRVEPFPPRVEDHDLPIPLPRLSEWIRADAIKGINVHTIPTSP
ncbi:hypothetical protein DXG03_002673 [Asterophora parasitica]|uniref:Uncharacterized protein n=1 Tax=Asterophora parasitica TaxID=117018 RepID=A0A9P7GDG9_9AGAR|nr:hypothetical protein DXG03_002673 [Asterophora parasitica]